MTICYIGAGSNLGDRRATLDRALEHLCSNRLIRRRNRSPFYETEPAGFLPQGRFLNAVWEIETELPPEALLKELIRIENYCGRERSIKNGPRTLDLDLLAYGNSVIEIPNLTVPHPRLHQRIFVLKPFADVNPEWRHPRLGRSVRELLDNLKSDASLLSRDGSASLRCHLPGACDPGQVLFRIPPPRRGHPAL